jgi:hypothetical protein
MATMTRHDWAEVFVLVWVCWSIAMVVYAFDLVPL